ncbi:PAS domain-containing protein, partial [Pseudomonas sp. GP01-A4]|uniref:PAS domain-containing protein n=2 Tax=Pseudomonadota TaxID=1224 RepID=UPI000CC4A24F
MKHPSSRAFFAYWDKMRGSARAPDRAAIDPTAVRELLGDIFVLSCEPKTGFPFRVAGTRVCALAGRDLKDQGFAALFT